MNTTDFLVKYLRDKLPNHEVPVCSRDVEPGHDYFIIHPVGSKMDFCLVHVRGGNEICIHRRSSRPICTYSLSQPDSLENIAAAIKELCDQPGGSLADLGSPDKEDLTAEE